MIKHHRAQTKLFINLSALFMQEWKKTLSAEADDRCWLKDKYYLYFCTRFLLMHILSCIDIQSTKQLFCISQRPYNILFLHGNLFYTGHCSIKSGGKKYIYFKKIFKFYLKYSFLLKCVNGAIERSINCHV